jgi:hypothetical protein
MSFLAQNVIAIVSDARPTTGAAWVPISNHYNTYSVHEDGDDKLGDQLPMAPMMAAIEYGMAMLSATMI